MWAKLAAFYNRAKSANSAISLFERIWWLFATVFGSAVIAWASSTWNWYWVTYSWAGVAFAFVVSLGCLSFAFFLTGLGVHYWRGGRSWNAGLRRPVSRQELDYRVQQRKFVLSNLGEMLTAYLNVMSILSDKCGQTGNELIGQMHWFADYSLHRVKRQYAVLESAAKRDFTGILTEEVNENILQFLKEYAIAAAFPGKIEATAGFGKTPRDQWDATHQRCRAALLDLKASALSGVLTEDNAIDTMHVSPRNR